MAEEITLGTKVRFHTYLRRGTLESRRENFSGYYRDKVWFPTDGPIREGIVVGRRTLSNGQREWEDEVGYSYTPTASFPAYIVAYDLHRAHINVRPEDLEIIDG